MQPEKVSIVIPTYNRAFKIGSLISTIMAQTYRPLELIVVNDGSGDDTVLRLESFRKTLEDADITVIFRSIPHSGQDAAMNEGLKHVSGEYFFWCDDDDELMPGAISSKVEWLQNHSEYGFVRSDAILVDAASGKELRHAYEEEHLKGSDILNDLLNDTMPCLAGTYLMKTSLLDEIYPERTIPLCGEGQNLQFLIPAAMASECGYIDEAQLRYMIRPDSHSSKGRPLTELLARNERFRELKLTLLRGNKEKLADIVHGTHDKYRRKILESAAIKAISNLQ